MKFTRRLSCTEAIREALDIALQQDPSVFIIGEGIPDYKGSFGTTVGLQKKYGKHRVMDMPVSENGMTGVCIGAAIGGMRPILTHLRVDFSLLSFDQIVNMAAKWYYTFGGQVPIPFVIRMIIGRGWGQGPQHSQSFQSLFAHIPGLKVVMPSTPYNAKGLLISSIADNNPVIFIEDRWLYPITGNVPKGSYTLPLGRAKILKPGDDVTIVASSYMIIESLKAIHMLHDAHISCELIDIRTLRPFDSKTISKSVIKTKRFLVVDEGHKTNGFAGEVIASVVEKGMKLMTAPRRLCLPDMPSPTSWKLAYDYYPTSRDIAREVMDMMGFGAERIQALLSRYASSKNAHFDQPEPVASSLLTQVNEVG